MRSVSPAWVRAPPDSREGGLRAVAYHAGNGDWQRASFSPPGSSESPAKSPDGHHSRDARFSPRLKHDKARKWSVPKRSGRGWSQFVDSTLSTAPCEFVHPVNPDLTPLSFWSVLSEFRQTHANVRDSVSQADTLLEPARLPQIVPKLNFSRLPGVKSIIPTNEHNVQQRRDHHRSPSRVRREGGETNASLREPHTGLNSEPCRGIEAELKDIFSPAAHRRRSLLATDEEVMGLQHRRLGIHPYGKKWDLRGQLRAEDRTLQMTQVAAAIVSNPTLEVCACGFQLVFSFLPVALSRGHQLRRVAARCNAPTLSMAASGPCASPPRAQL